MIAGGVTDSFWKAHWDWLALGGAVLVLAAAGLVLANVYSVDADEVASELVATSVAKPTPGKSGVATFEDAPYEHAKSLAKNPPELAPIVSKDGNFLTAPGRVRCEFCNAVRHAGTNECAACHRVPTAEELPKAVLDGDGDGLPDAWEKKYGLDPKNPADAQTDTDGDGFTNAEEFAAKTDPAAKSSHPDYLASLTLQLPLKETHVPFFFTGVYKTPSGLKYNFKDPSRVREYDRGVYSVLEGAEIGKSGFLAKSYEEKSAKRKLGGGMTKNVDVSEATVVRLADKRAVKLVINHAKTPIDVQAKLVFTRGQTKEFTVVGGSQITLFDETFTVKSVESDGKGARVTLVDASNREHAIQALEQ